MEIFKIVGIGLLTCIVAMVLKQIKPEMSLIVVVGGSLIIFLMVVDMLSGVFLMFESLVEKTGIDSEIYGILLKIIGVGYICEFSASICTDSGNSSIADKILLAGKIIILVLSLPIIKSLLDIIMGLLP